MFMVTAMVPQDSGKRQRCPRWAGTFGSSGEGPQWQRGATPRHCCFLLGSCGFSGVCSRSRAAQRCEHFQGKVSAGERPAHDGGDPGGSMGGNLHGHGRVLVTEGARVNIHDGRVRDLGRPQRTVAGVRPNPISDTAVGTDDSGAGGKPCIRAR